jgi:uroporphyrinogen decarboxylase
VLEPIRDRAGVSALREDSAERLSPVYQTVRNLRAALPAEVALIGFAGAPWTVAAYMVEGRGGKGFVAARRWAFSDPDGFQTLIDMVTEATIHYLLAQIEAGANAIQIFDSWAGLLPASQLERWVIRPTRRIVEALKARYPQVPVIGFPRGVGPAVPAYCAGTGVDGVSLDESLDPAWAAQAVPAGVVLQGNMDPQFVVAGGPAMRAEADRILAVLAGRPHIFNLGHGLVPETPPEHVGELVAHIRAPVGAGA